MRVLWIDADKNPWTDASGWKVLEDFGLFVRRVASVAEAQEEFEKKNFDLLLLRAELPGAEAFLNAAKKILWKNPRRIVLASSTWSKEQFKSHSRSESAAHRYARVPMPPEGFLGLVADLFGCTVEELGDFVVEDSADVSAPAAAVGPTMTKPLASATQTATAKKAAPPPKAKPKAAAPKASSMDSADADVLKKYLRIKEEQLEISESEREELALENERFQKEAHQLQIRLRELEHLHDELTKKLAHMESEREESDRKIEMDRQEHERSAKAQQDLIRGLEQQLNDASEKYENLRIRVRKDIRKIRENERDLEARLELTRKDSATLLAARDERVLEMQRKIDALEFDLDQIQDSRVQAQMEAERYLAKLSRVARALHLAVNMIEDEPVSDEELDELEPLAGGAANAEEPKASSGGGSNDGGSGEGGGPTGAELPPAEEASPADGGMSALDLSPELAALAADGEPTRIVSAEALEQMGGEPESNSG